jgi:SH3-like domain-containing protein
MKASAAALVLAMVGLLAGAHARAASGDAANLPVPRFVSLRATEANLRTGPGEQYPITWILRHQGVPLEVVAEYNHWRRVRDFEGAEGWIHRGMLTGRRTVVVTAKLPLLLAEARSDGQPLARLEARVIARVLRCPAQSAWCQIEADAYRGWIRRADIWGVYDDERVD